jgi:hypothetical protein
LSYFIQSFIPIIYKYALKTNAKNNNIIENEKCINNKNKNFINDNDNRINNDNDNITDNERLISYTITSI